MVQNEILSAEFANNVAAAVGNPCDALNRSSIARPVCTGFAAIRVGRANALSVAMAKSCRELVSWQLAFELSERVIRLLQSGPASKDFTSRDQLADSVRSAPRNIAEGFGRFNPTEIAQFADYAIGSLDETENHLRDGVASGYFSAEAVGPLILLLVRCRKALAFWHTYLRSVKNDPRFNQGKRKK